MEKLGTTWATDWPWFGTTARETDGEMSRIIKLPSPYEGKGRAICFPGTPLNSNVSGSGNVVNALSGHLLNKHFNGIGTHTGKVSAEAGFEGPQAIEKAVVGMVAGTLGAQEEIDGHFCSGGTDANIEGMWIGREYLLNEGPEKTSKRIAVLITRLTHYSILKGARILSLGNLVIRQCSKCNEKHIIRSSDGAFGRIEFVGMNKYGEMNPALLLEAIVQLKKAGYGRFLIIPTAGTTAFGSIDPIIEIAEVAKGSLKDGEYYIHVDAAFAGFTIPFLGGPSIGFDIPGVQSMTVDAHKMGHLPYPAGMFLCRKGLQDHIRGEVEYVSGHSDSTLIGSRPFFPAGMGYVLFRSMGISGHTEYVKACIEARDRLVKKLISIGDQRVQIVHASPYVNQLALEVKMEKGRISEEVEKSELLEKYVLRHDFFPSSPEKSNSCPRIVYKICVMPHTIGYIDDFVADLGKVLSKDK